MLKELLAIFRQDSKLDAAFARSYEMLDINKDMFLKARRTLRETNTVELDTSVYEQDKKINQFEREVRRELLQYLSVTGVGNLPSALRLIGIIVDLELIGDYAKNIVELAESHKAKLNAGEAEEDLRKIESAVENTFDRTRYVLENSDAEAAEALIREYIWVNPLCDKIALGYIKEENETLTRRSTAALVLYFRFLKRIHSHLRNIVTAVYRPFHKIGFIPSKDKIPRA